MFKSSYHFLYLFLFFTTSCNAQNQVYEKLTIGEEMIDLNNASSEYYPDSVRLKLRDLDTTITPLQILSYTWYVQQSNLFNPKKIDQKARKMYKENENSNYKKAIKIGHELLDISPNNITAFKELAFAYTRLDKKDSIDIYMTMMKKSIEATTLFGDGSYTSPYLLNNSFELFSIIEATYRFNVKQSKPLKDSNGRILVFSKFIGMGKFVLLNHWAKHLKKGEYVEGDLDINFDINQAIKEDFKNMKH